MLMTLAEKIGEGETMAAALAAAGLPRREFGSPNGFYVYILVDPANDLPFYVGKGKGDRAKAHALAERRGADSNSVKAQKLCSIRLAGAEVGIVIVADGLTEANALAVERDFIRAGRAVLSNISQGQVTATDRWRASLERSLATYDAITSIPSGDDEFHDVLLALADGCRRLLAYTPTDAELLCEEDDLRKLRDENRKAIDRLMCDVDVRLTAGGEIKCPA